MLCLWRAVLDAEQPALSQASESKTVQLTVAMELIMTFAHSLHDQEMQYYRKWASSPTKNVFW